MRWIVATGNPGKARDFEAIALALGSKLEAIPMADFGGMPDVIEDQPDFRGNALLKVNAIRDHRPDLDEEWVLADDSGLEVDALDGRPGVISARYAGEGAGDRANREKLLSELDGVTAPKRSASFVCHLCLSSPTGEVFHFEGRKSGTIATSSAGDSGYGYDPVFLPKGEDLTWAEMGVEVKNQDNHRVRAVKGLLNKLQGSELK